MRGVAGLQVDSARRIATAEFWSKALGSPIVSVSAGPAGTTAKPARSIGFNQPERVLEEPALGLVAAVSTPAVPPFDSFAC